MNREPLFDFISGFTIGAALGAIVGVFAATWNT